MKSIYVIVLLLLITTSPVVFSQKGKPPRTKASAATTKLSKKTPTIKDEAYEEAVRHWERYYTKCGDSYYLDLGRSWGICEYRSVSIVNRELQLTEADKLNGVEREVLSHFDAKAERCYTNDWSQWHDAARVSVGLIKKSGNWSEEGVPLGLIPIMALKSTKISCSEVPSWAISPDLLTNRAAALKVRGVERYNAAVQSSDDDATRTARIEAAKSDFKHATEAANKAAELIKKEPAATNPNDQRKQKANKYAALKVRAEAYHLFVTKVDPTQADAGIAAFEDYIAVEIDPAKKSKAELDLAQMLLDAGANNKAYTQYQKILGEKPDDLDANLGAGLALYFTDDKAKYKDAANYLQKFVDRAPDTHRSKNDAKDILAKLKDAENQSVFQIPTRFRLKDQGISMGSTWSRLDSTTWVEDNPDGHSYRFRVVEHARVEGIQGTVVRRNPDSLDIFIPDMNSGSVLVKFRAQGNSQWKPLREMVDVESK